MLARVIAQIKPIYEDLSSGKDQQRFIETIIGAAVWYLPEAEECWTGKISVSALESHHPGFGVSEAKLTKDHEYPRKVAAADLLASSGDEGIDSEELFELYIAKYGKYNYVTPQKNKASTKYQKKGVFSQPADAYKKAGIQLLPLTSDDLKKVKARQQKPIETLLAHKLGRT